MALSCQVLTFADIFDRIYSAIGRGSTGADHGAWSRRTGAAQMAQNKLNKELKNLRTDPMPQGDAAPKGEDMYSWEGFINGAYVLRAAVKAAHSVREGA